MNTKLVPIFDYRPVHGPRPWSEGRGFAPVSGGAERRAAGVAAVESDGINTAVTRESDATTSVGDTIPLIALSSSTEIRD